MSRTFQQALTGVDLRVYSRMLFCGCLAALFVFVARVAGADDKIGKLEIQDVILRPNVTSIEDVGAEFDMNDSSLTLKWSNEHRLSGKLSVGSTLQRNMPVYYDSPNTPQLGFYEGYAQYDGIYGRFRAGLVPLSFGFDGTLSDSERYYRDSLVYAARLIGKRDIGASFQTEYNGYYTELVVHNGEVDAPSDGRLWTSANWGFTDKKNFRAQLSLQTGFVKGAFSSPTNAIAGVTPGRTARWRNGLLFANWYPHGWNILAEIGGGEVDQDRREGRYFTDLVEVTRHFTKNFGVGFRFNQLDPDRKIDGDSTSEASLLFLFTSDDAVSSVILTGTKVIEESHEIPNDVVRVSWLLTPYAQ